MWHTLISWSTKFIWTTKFTSCPAENTPILRYVDELVISVDRGRYSLFWESYEIHKHNILAKCTVLNVDAESTFVITVVLSTDYPVSWSQLFRNSSVSQEFPTVFVTRKFITVHRCYYLSLTWVPWLPSFSNIHFSITVTWTYTSSNDIVHLGYHCKAWCKIHAVFLLKK
jgi:hypothetical protein